MLEPGAIVTDAGEKLVRTVLTTDAAGADGVDGVPGVGVSAGGLFVTPSGSTAAPPPPQAISGATIYMNAIL